MQRALLLLLVAASYLLFAGGRPWTLGPLLAIAAAAASVSPRRTFAFPHAHRSLDFALIAILVAIALQLVPLPAGVVSAVSPHAADVRRSIQFTTFESALPGWTTLSINPRATLVSLGTVALGVLAFWSARGMFGARGNTRAMCRGLAFLGAVAAVAALLQRAMAPHSILFVLEPEARSANPFGAFVNRNHFAAWLLLIAAPVTGYTIARMHIHPTSRGRWRQSIGQVMSSGALYTALAVFVQIGALLVTLSRSALVGLGSAAITGWHLGRPRMQIERTSLPAALGFTGAVLLLLMLFVDVDSWATRLGHSLGSGDTAFSRLTIWKESWPVVSDFWATGSGAGTYADAMARYQQTRMWVGSMQRWALFNNAHSHYVQVASEGGLLLVIPVVLAILAAVTLGLRAVRADKGEMFWVRVGAIAGLAGLAVQSLWEVALIMPANAVLTGVVGGLMLYRREQYFADSPLPDPEPLPPRPTPARVR